MSERKKYEFEYMQKIEKWFFEGFVDKDNDFEEITISDSTYTDDIEFWFKDGEHMVFTRRKD